ncbi:MAG: 50S ribosomal protein L6 [Candidatus Wildermuthbacteria bacterium]|nr:50S ribosomal protein L6 [Candidatus Wildermuthbacteria bacterium]
MSRIGKKEIVIPQGVQAEVQGQTVNIKGPKGELVLQVHQDIAVELKDQHIVLAPKSQEYVAKPVRALWGTMRQLIFNMVQGVMQGYEKKLEIEGVGFKAAVEGDLLALTIGFTEPVKLKIPQGVKVLVEKSVIAVSGPEKEKVGQFAASVRKAKPVEPYKGKGIKYQGEFVRRKLGKRAAATTGTGAAK